MVLSRDDEVAVALVGAIQSGDVGSVRRLLAEHPGAGRARIEQRPGVTRTLLHAVTDWPGYFPDGPRMVRILVDAGADVDAPVIGGPHAETPLHWAASSDDVDVAAALIDAGADLEAPGASIAGGPPLDDAVGYGCWHVARLLVDRGARVDRLWHAAALGLPERLDELLASDPAPTAEELTQAFWHACSGGQRRAAERLLDLGADVNGIPAYSSRSPLDVAGAPDTRRGILVTWLQSRGAVSARS